MPDPKDLDREMMLGFLAFLGSVLFNGYLLYQAYRFLNSFPTFPG